MSDPVEEVVKDEAAPAPAAPRGVLKGDAGTERAMVVMAALLVALACVFLHVAALQVPFFGPDLDLFVTHTSLHRLVTAPDAFDRVPHAPLTALGYALNWALAPGPMGMHLGNLLLHVAAVVLVYLCGRRLAPDGTPEWLLMLPALSFGCNPAAADAIAIVAERPVVQALALGLFAVYCFQNAMRSTGGRGGWAALAIAMLAGATASHPIGLLAAPVAAMAAAGKSAPGQGRALQGVLLATTAVLAVALFAGGGSPLSLDAFVASVKDGAPYAVPAMVALAVAPVLGKPHVTLRYGMSGLLGLIVVLGAVQSVRSTWARLDAETFLKLAAEAKGDAETWKQLAEYQLTLPGAEGAPAGAKARPALEQWRAKAPENARAAALLGGALLETGKADEALPVLLDALRLDPWSGGVAAQVAGVYEQRARTEGRETLLLARDYYQMAHARGALTKEQLEPYALVLAGTGDLSRASAVLREAIGDAKEGPAAAALARFESGRKQIAQREDNVNKQFAQPGGGGSVGVVLRAELAYLKGHYMESFYLLERLLRNEPENVQAWSMLGLVRARMQQGEQFLAENADKPAATGPAWDDVVRRCAASGQWDAALAYIQRSPGENPEVRLASIAQEYRQPQRVESLLRLAAEKAPENPLPWLRLCDLAIEAKDIAKANQSLAEAQKRGASDEQLKPLRDKLGTPQTPGAVPMQKIVN